MSRHAPFDPRHEEQSLATMSWAGHDEEPKEASKEEKVMDLLRAATEEAGAIVGIIWVSSTEVYEIKADGAQVLLDVIEDADKLADANKQVNPSLNDGRGLSSDGYGFAGFMPSNFGVLRNDDAEKIRKRIDEALMGNRISTCNVETHTNRLQHWDLKQLWEDARDSLDNPVKVPPTRHTT